LTVDVDGRDRAAGDITVEEEEEKKETRS